MKNTIRALALSAFGLCLVIAFYFLLPVNGQNGTTTFFTIEKGESARAIAHNLSEKKIINSEFALYSLTRFLRAEKNIKSGHYEVKGNFSYLKLVNLLKKGVSGKNIRVFIPEGTKAEDIYKILRRSDIKNDGEYEKYASSSTFLKKLNLFDQSVAIEGFLFPETYYFPQNASEQKVLLIMVNTFFKRLPKDFYTKSSKLDLLPYEALILASIIEKETGYEKDRSSISSVFHNRLLKKMRLQADPTVIYGIKNFDGNLRRKHLRTYTPYNTYVINRLPPTPISNPGFNSLKATLYPKKTQYLYFVAMGNGRSYFSKNLKEHNRAVNKYQRGL